MKTLVIPDIHNKTAKVSAILEHELYDQVIFLNDVFDDFGDTPEIAYRVAWWLKDRLQDPRNIFLHSNHTTSYMYDQNRNAYCSGFEDEKARAIREVLTYSDFKQFKSYHVQDGILFTHAGLSNRLLKNHHVSPKNIVDLDYVADWLDGQTNEAINAYERGDPHFLFGAGYSRRGRYPVGGITWADFHSDMVPTEFPQIFGHTPVKQSMFVCRERDTPKMKVVKANSIRGEELDNYQWGLNLDTHMNGYAILEDGLLSVMECIWDGNKLDNVTGVFHTHL